MAKKNAKPAEEEFDDIFDGDDEDSEEVEFEDDDEDGEDEFDDEESEDEEDDEDDEDEFEEDEELDEDIDDAVDAGLQENSTGISAEVFSEAIAGLNARLENIEALLKKAANSGGTTTKTPSQGPSTEKKAKAPKQAETEQPKRGRGRPPGSKNKAAETPAPSVKKTKEAAAPVDLNKKQAAVVLAAMNAKSDRKGTDANKFARALSSKKFGGTPDAGAIMKWLVDNKHVFGSGTKEGTFRR